jgi:DNA mismatch repair protein MutL
VRVRGGEVGGVRPAAVAPGSVIEVRNLFFNTPARRKFLSQAAGEARACARALTRLALGAPHVGFRLEHGGRLLLEAPAQPEDDAAEALRGRITHLFGRALAEDLVAVSGARDGVRLSGLAALPRRTRGDSTHQFVTLKVRGGEARPIRDKLLAAAIKEGYRGLLMTRRHAVVFLELEIDPSLVDVNVHPAKLEVRFRNRGDVFGMVVRALREALDARPELARLEVAADAAGAARRSAGPDLGDRGAAAAPGAGPGRRPVQRWDWRPDSRDRSREVPALAAAASAATATCAGLPAEAPTRDPAPGGQPGLSGLEEAALPRSLQLSSGYLVVASGDGFEVIDPHALHERIIFEQLKARVEAGALEVQPLLVPTVVDLGPEEVAVAEQARAPLAEVGLVIEPFGAGSWAVQAYPALLEGPGGRRLDLAALVRDCLETVAEGRRLERSALLEHILATLACKAAVKLGERLREGEVEALLRRRAIAERSHLCPHGRPSALAFSGLDLERQFRR